MRQGMTAIESGGNPVLIKRGIDVAVARLVEHLGGVTHPLRTEDDFRRVAAISANDDETIGDAVARALYTVGDGGHRHEDPPSSASTSTSSRTSSSTTATSPRTSPTSRLEAVVQDC